MSAPVQTFDDQILQSFPATFESLKKKGVLNPIITLENLKTGLSEQQRTIVDQIINLNPVDYGVKTPYAGDLEQVPNDLVKISGQNYSIREQPKTLDDKYVPNHIFNAYTRMNDSFMDENPSRKLLVGSCYRSPAYQVVVFINWLVNAYGGDISMTIRQASPPNYSQHTIVSKAAIDFMNIDGSPSEDNPEDFKESVEYSWLCVHAKEFGFFESWLEGNKFGMRAEPWHWQYLGAKAHLN